MTNLRDVLDPYVSDGTIAGAVALVARGDQIQVASVGLADVDSKTPMARDTIFRIASITKPIISAAAMMLVDDGRMALDDPIDEWLPELASPMVVRTPAGAIDDVVPAARPITIVHLLSSLTGYGFPSDFALPQVELLFEKTQKYGRDPQFVQPIDEWMADLGGIPLLHQPGDAWLYNTSYDILGVLIARVSGQPLPDFLAERMFSPLGMVDSGFAVPLGKLDRFATYYGPGLELVDAPDGQWSSLPAFPSGAGGLVGTVDDWLAFGRMLLNGGTVDGRRLLSAESVRLMTTNQLTQTQSAANELFLEGQGWGFGGTVDVAPIDPWNVPGRYGWVGGTGTSAHIVPSTGSVNILFTQLAAANPLPPDHIRDFWRHAA